MRIEKRKGVVAIQATTPEEFNRQINSVLEKYDAPKVHFITSGDKLGAYVEYDTTKEVPETLAEKYELAGDERPCTECPYFVRTKDRRFKWHYCIQKQKKVFESQRACDTYYQILEETIAEEMKEAGKC